MVTNKMKNQIRFCEDWLHILFEGNIESKDDVKDFLAENLDDAMEICDNAVSAYINELDS